MSYKKQNKSVLLLLWHKNSTVHTATLEKRNDDADLGTHIASALVRLLIPFQHNQKQETQKTKKKTQRRKMKCNHRTDLQG